MAIDRPRYRLRDFEEADRGAFAYQMDPRYLALYDLSADRTRANGLFDLFLGWQAEEPRSNFQLGVFDRCSGSLCGCAGLRGAGPRKAVLGIELAPDQWGRFGLALDATSALLDFGFGRLELRRIMGTTASGNWRVERLARWFDATVVARRQGPEWMRGRGWQEVDWVLDRERWAIGREKAEGHRRKPFGRKTAAPSRAGRVDYVPRSLS